MRNQNAIKRGFKNLKISLRLQREIENKIDEIEEKIKRIEWDEAHINAKMRAYQELGTFIHILREDRVTIQITKDKLLSNNITG